MLRVILLLCMLFTSLARGEDFLEPEEAFKPSLRAVDARTLEVVFDIAPGYHLYRSKFQFASADPAVRLGAPRLPAGQIKEDEYFGRVEVYHGRIAVRLPVERAGGGSVRLEAGWQGCAEAGLCYPPQTAQLSTVLPAAAQAGPAAGAAPARPGGERADQDVGARAVAESSLPAAPPVAASPSAPASGGDESGRIAQSLKHAGFMANLLFFFLAGLGLSLTPCVFPMIPILSGIIAGQGGQLSRGRGFALSVAYVLGMALTYSAAGVAAGMTGTLISNALQNPWALGGFALVFVALSLSMFGFYNLQLPSALQSRLNDGAGHLQGGRGVGVFLMGALSALIVGPCVAAPLAGALLYIGQTGNAVLGGFALFAMALGMGVPLLLVGLSAGTLLPRAGGWMESVKKFFGVLLLATAVWLVSPVIPVALQMVAWGLLLIVPAMYLHAFDPLPANAGGWKRFWKGAGVAMVITGAAMLVGVLAGSRDPLQPLGFLAQSGNAQVAATAGKPVFERVASAAELDARLQAAQGPVMLDVYADWCVACKELEHQTFSDPAVRARLAEFTLLQADVTDNSDTDRALLKRFGLFGPPGVMFFAPGGREHSAQRVVGFQDAERFLKTLDSLR